MGKGQSAGEEDTLYPEGLELSHPKFALDRRNRWMIDAAEYCICYVNHDWGGAYKFVSFAKSKGLQIQNLANFQI